MFVDASALVAMMTDEADAAALASRLAATGGKPIRGSHIIAAILATKQNIRGTFFGYVDGLRDLG